MLNFSSHPRGHSQQRNQKTLHHSMILSALGPDHALTVLFLGTHTRTSQWVTHPGIALARTPIELPKGLVLGRDEKKYIYKDHSPRRCGMSQSTPIRGPTSSSAHFRPGIGSDTKFITSRARLHHSTILSALGPDHALTVLFMGTHTRTSQWVTHPGIALVRTRLTSEFRWNPRLVSSQKASW
ncbi:unnamed protein product [Malus baccata var. baccata]